MAENIHQHSQMSNNNVKKIHFKILYLFKFIIGSSIFMYFGESYYFTYADTIAILKLAYIIFLSGL